MICDICKRPQKKNEDYFVTRESNKIVVYCPECWKKKE